MEKKEEIEDHQVQEGVHEEMDVVPGTLHGEQYSQYLCDELS